MNFLLSFVHMEAETILAVTGVTKRYGDLKVLDDVSFSLAAGASLALVGANGAGKSTLIKIILGLCHPSAGGGQLFGHPFHRPEGRARVGYLPEFPSFWPELNARELLGFFGRFRSIDEPERTRRAEKMLSVLGLSGRAGRRLGGYSKGMLQRSGLAQALLHDPKLLILDEPMSGLDPRAQSKLRDIFSALRAQGKSFLISSHSLEDIRLLCDEVVVLEKSKLTLSGPTNEVLGRLLQKYQNSEPWDDDPMGDLSSGL